MNMSSIRLREVLKLTLNCHVEYFYPVNLQHSSCKHVFSIKMKTVWILISWLHQKPAYLDLHCFLKRIQNVYSGSAVS